MTLIAPESEMISTLAERIEEDILRRGLRHGDLYLSTSEAARRFSASRASTNRAMDLLALRGLLERRQGRGTYVGASMRKNAQKVFQTVSLLYPQEAVAHTDPLTWMALRSLDDEASNLGSLQINFVPRRDRLEFLRQMLDSGRRAGTLRALIAISPSADACALLARAPLPVVAIGAAARGRSAPVTLNMDEAEAGRLLAEHFVRRGFRRILLASFLPETAGMARLRDGARRTLARAGLPASAIQLLDPRALTSPTPVTLEEALPADSPPVALIADGYPLADRLLRTTSAVRRSGRQVAVGCVVPLLSPRQERPYIQVVAGEQPREQMRQVVSLIERLQAGEILTNLSMTSPVRLHPPDRTTGRLSSQTSVPIFPYKETLL